MPGFFPAAAASRGADLAVKTISDQNLSEFSKVKLLVRFDELETVRSFLNQELYVVEKVHVNRREMRIIVVPLLLHKAPD